MLSRAEARQLVCLARAMRACADRPEVTVHLAGLLEAWTAEHVSQGRGLDDEQMQLFAAAADEERAPIDLEALEGSSEAPLHNALHSSERACAAPPTTHREVTAAPSVSLSDQQRLDRSGSKSARHRPHSDAPLSDAFRKVYDDVAAERCVMLPSATFVWSKFLEHLWSVDRSFATPWNLKRAWRDWCGRERPVTQRAPDAPAPAASDDAPPPSRRRELLLAQERERIERESQTWDTPRARGELKSTTERRATGPPSKAPAVA